MLLVMDREVDQMYGKFIILGVKKNRYFIPFYMKNKSLCGLEQVLYLYKGVLKCIIYLFLKYVRKT